jgi:thiol-disulfide isomerase/thioredoxin
MLVELDLEKVQQKINQKHTFVLNIIASWCPDCTDRQAPELPGFVSALESSNIDVINLLVQQEKRVYLSAQHQEFVDALGGHGFPRTVLFKEGVSADSDNVEIITAEQLKALAERFISTL